MKHDAIPGKILKLQIHTYCSRQTTNIYAFNRYMHVY